MKPNQWSLHDSTDDWNSENIILPIVCLRCNIPYHIYSERNSVFGHNAVLIYTTLGKYCPCYNVRFINLLEKRVEFGEKRLRVGKDYV